MKKIISIAVVAATLTLALAGCSGGYKNGTYKAEAAEYSHDWKDYVIVSVSGGDVTIQEYDSLNAAGEKKSEDAEYREAMEPVSGTYPGKYFPDIIAEYEAKGSVDKMDSITGATNSTDSFKALVTAALENAKKGDTATATVPVE
ncbi:MAG: FMN-binding protein [Acetanaerobacterium sp.]